MSIKNELRQATIRHAVRVAVNDLQRTWAANSFWCKLIDANGTVELSHDLARWEDDGGASHTGGR